MNRLLAIAATALLATPALADLQVEFRESAPKDIFTISNTSDCPIENLTLTIDLSTSPSGLIFDVTAQGAGVQVFQPFDLVEGQDQIAELPKVTDGQTLIELKINSLPKGRDIAFTIDVDDTSGSAETIVQGSEIQGASIRAANLTALFDQSAMASLPYAGCPS